MSKTNKAFDRYMNPDGGRKRKESQIHKSPKDYKKLSNQELKDLLNKTKDDNNI